MPLEALRWPITPVGLHYLLIHYDVPDVDGAVWGLRVRGERELSLGLDEIRRRPRIELAVTMECAGNGRARLEPRPGSQPWLSEAIGAARRGGKALRAAASRSSRRRPGRRGGRLRRSGRCSRRPGCARAPS